MSKKLLVVSMVWLLLLGCVRQDAWLSYTDPESPRPSAASDATPEPTRAPEQLTFEPVKGESWETDRNGIPILDAENHYFTYYLTFSRIRVYELDGYTYLDGVCTNGFSATLTGEAYVYFYDENEKMVGFGRLHTAEGDLTLPVGDTRIYSEILSEVDVQQLTMEIAQTSAFHPV